jgi:hypothetical protein
MINKQFHNDATQRERRQVLDNERTVKRENDCYMSRAEASVGEELGGRFKRYTPYSVEPVPQYPRLPSGPWAANEAGDELDPAPDIGYPQTDAASLPVNASVAPTTDPNPVGGDAAVGADLPTPPVLPAGGEAVVPTTDTTASAPPLSGSAIPTGGSGGAPSPQRLRRI